MRRYTAHGRLMADTDPDLECFFVHYSDAMQEIEHLRAYQQQMNDILKENASLRNDLTAALLEAEELRKRLDSWYTVEAQIAGALFAIVGEDAYLKAIAQVGAEAAVHNPKLTQHPTGDG